MIVNTWFVPTTLVAVAGVIWILAFTQIFCALPLPPAAVFTAVPVVRVSQGSGVFMHTDEELDEMARLGATVGVEVSLFARPNAGWDTSAMARAPVGPLVAPAARGTEQLVAVLEDARRAAVHGIRSVLIQDLGALSIFAAMRTAGELPADMQAKVSVMLPVANPAAARVIADLGANTINLPTDLTLAQIAAIRSAVDVPLDIYVECPDNLGGFIRFHEIAEHVDHVLRNRHGNEFGEVDDRAHDLAIRAQHARLRPVYAVVKRE